MNKLLTMKLVQVVTMSTQWLKLFNKHVLFWGVFVVEATTKHIRVGQIGTLVLALKDRPLGQPLDIVNVALCGPNLNLI